MNTYKLLLFLTLNCAILPSYASSNEPLRTGCNNPEIDYPSIEKQLRHAFFQAVGANEAIKSQLKKAQTPEQTAQLSSDADRLNREFINLHDAYFDIVQRCEDEPRR